MNEPSGNQLSELIERGSALVRQGLPGEAAKEFQKAVDQESGNIRAWHYLGDALRRNGRFGDAAKAFVKVVELAPDEAGSHLNLAAALAECAEIDRALASFDRAMALAPENAAAAGTRLFTLYFSDGVTEARLIEEHRRWAQRFAEPLKSNWRAHPNSRDENRKLKIGYVSSELRLQPVGRFMLPLFWEHDRERFEIFAYHAGEIEDEITVRIKSKCDGWRNIHGIGDEAAAELIRADGIDILVDLSMHMGRRLGIFARKPAPVQITYLAYVGTTGLDAIDYRITDRMLEPTPAGFVEKPLYVPNYWCFKPSIWNIEPGAPPFGRNGFVTFGSLNSFKKAGHGARKLWADVLTAAVDSRMIVHASEGSHRDAFLSEMRSHGIDASRFSFVGLLPIDQYMQTYQEIDICLDTFPYTGGTTTCDALWMGVPTVTLAGKLGISRMGVSILSAVGLNEFIAETPERFKEIVMLLADRRDKLARYRETIRDRLKSSPLFDAKLFARSIESGYRDAWRNWCEDGLSSAE